MLSKSGVPDVPGEPPADPAGPVGAESLMRASLELPASGDPGGEHLRPLVCWDIDRLENISSARKWRLRTPT
ncbi:hypothetical protein GCM10012287_13180 [Streptomyces daqingensis]|uniref:Uncharacterized protein n=1 Tax=Streptomyces daqingensis TaxID=1472640 RepID=A0ABQ2M0D1_9ACTN|nr:hypothetical protein GCM10012287_13180 [Streptomyces daqingensis]